MTNSVLFFSLLAHTGWHWCSIQGSVGKMSREPQALGGHLGTEARPLLLSDYYPLQVKSSRVKVANFKKKKITYHIKVQHKLYLTPPSHNKQYYILSNIQNNTFAITWIKQQYRVFEKSSLLLSVISYGHLRSQLSEPIYLHLNPEC